MARGVFKHVAESLIAHLCVFMYNHPDLRLKLPGPDSFLVEGRHGSIPDNK